MMMPSRDDPFKDKEPFRRGFSLIEMLVAMGIFMLISAVAFSLFNRHQNLYTQEQVTVGLNIGLRNALAQIQLDVANAGNGLILGTNVPAWPVGVTIINSNPSVSQCNPAASDPPVYAAACFDQLNIIVVDPNTPAVHPCVTTGCTMSTSAGNSLYGQPAPPSLPSQIKGNFHAGDQVLFVQSCAGGGHANGSSGCAFTTALLTSAGSLNTTAPGCSAGCVGLTFNSTQGGGGNGGANDPLGMTTNAPAAELTDSFGPNDWVVRLLPINYSVNANHVDSSHQPDPQLVRTQGGVQNSVMDQVIVFKVGAALWNNANTSTFQYNYNAASYSFGSSPVIPAPWQYNLIRSVRVSLVGRTEPNPTLPYRNLFDSGPYQIRGSSMIINPRNLTMNND